MTLPTTTPVDRTPRETLLLAVDLLVLAILILGGGILTESWIAAGAGLVLLAVAVWWLKRSGVSLVGPLVGFDLVRLARRGRGLTLRVGYAALLLLVLGFLYITHFNSSISEVLLLRGETLVSLAAQADFAHTFVLGFLIFQNIAVLILTPPYLASAIAEEKEKRSLDLLLTTQLSAREIVLGKMMSRLLHIAGVILAGLPVLSLAQLWGGVDVGLLLAGFAMTAFTLLSVGAVAIVCSVQARTVVGAVITAYLLAAVWSFHCLCPPCGFASPVRALLEVNQQLLGNDDWVGGATPPSPSQTREILIRSVLAYGAVHTLIAGVALAWAVSQLRIMNAPRSEFPFPIPAPEAVGKPWSDPPDIPVAAQPQMLVVPRRSPPVGDDALYWKEVLFSTGENWTRPTVIAALGLWGNLTILALVFGPGTTGADPSDYQAGLNLLVRVATVGLLGFWCLTTAFRAASSVSRERDQRTLDGLLTLPLSRAELLAAKWRGALQRGRNTGIWLAGAWLVGLCTGGMSFLGLATTLVTALAHLAFLTSLGLWLSVRSRSTLAAHFRTALAVLLFFAAPWLGWYVTDAGTGRLDACSSFFLVGLNPIRAWITLADYSHSGEVELHTAWVNSLTGTGTILLAAGVYAAGAWLLWRAALRRFDSEATASA